MHLYVNFQLNVKRAKFVSQPTLPDVGDNVDDHEHLPGGDRDSENVDDHG